MPDTQTKEPVLIVYREKDPKSVEVGWFAQADAARAKADRTKSGLTSMENLSEQVREFASRLPAGSFGPDGKLVLGVADRKTIDQLLALRSSERKTAVKSGEGPASSSTAGPVSATPEENVRPSPTTAELIEELWSKITIGSHVIAPEDDRAEDGWWEAVVTERRGRMLTLRWRDYPANRPFNRKLNEVALPHPKSGV